MNTIVYFVDTGDSDTEFFYGNERDARADALEISRASAGGGRAPEITVSRVVMRPTDHPGLMLALLNRAGFFKETRIIGTYRGGKEVGELKPPRELQSADAPRVGLGS